MSEQVANITTELAAPVTSGAETSGSGAGSNVASLVAGVKPAVISAPVADTRASALNDPNVVVQDGELSGDIFEDDYVAPEPKPQKQETKAVEPKPQEPPKEEVDEEAELFNLVVDEEVKPEEPKTETESQDTEKPVEAQPSGPARDYSGYKPEQVEILKKLPNLQFNKAKDYFKQINEQETKSQNGLPESYLEHPEAYKLTPEYSQVERQISLADFEAKHYRSQLGKIKRGEPWLKLKGYDSKTWEPVFEKINPLGEGEVDHDSEIEVQSMMGNASAARVNLENQLQQFVGNFAQGHKQTLATVTEIDNSYFKAFQNEKLPTEVKDTLGKIEGTLRTKLPAFKNSPLVPLLAKAAVSDIFKNKRIKSLEQEVSRLKQLTARQPSTGPTRKDFGGSAGAGEKVLDVKDFDEL